MAIRVTPIDDGVLVLVSPTVDLDWTTITETLTGEATDSFFETTADGLSIVDDASCQPEFTTDGSLVPLSDQYATPATVPADAVDRNRLWRMLGQSFHLGRSWRCSRDGIGDVRVGSAWICRARRDCGRGRRACRSGAMDLAHRRRSDLPSRRLPVVPVRRFVIRGSRGTCQWHRLADWSARNGVDYSVESGASMMGVTSTMLVQVGGTLTDWSGIAGPGVLASQSQTAVTDAGLAMVMMTSPDPLAAAGGVEKTIDSVTLRRASLSSPIEAFDAISGARIAADLLFTDPIDGGVIVQHEDGSTCAEFAFETVRPMLGFDRPPEGDVGWTLQTSLNGDRRCRRVDRRNCWAWTTPDISSVPRILPAVGNTTVARRDAQGTQHRRRPPPARAGWHPQDLN